MDRYIDIHTDKQTDILTERQADRQTDIAIIESSSYKDLQHLFLNILQNFSLILLNTKFIVNCIN